LSLRVAAAARRSYHDGLGECDLPPRFPHAALQRRGRGAAGR
jgi:hypothetical protein